MLVKHQLYFQRLRKRLKVGQDRGLYRVAGLIATACKRALRIRPGTSRPGAAPHAHTAGGLRIIRFFVDQFQAVIGPIKFARSNFFNKPVPAVHEFGGTLFNRRFGEFRNYPRRSYMKKTLDRLLQQGKIPREYSVEVRRVL
jgi:hypothetical protein